MTQEKSKKRKMMDDEEPIEENKKQKTQHKESQNGHSQNGSQEKNFALPKFQDGSIVQMTMHNFMTYDDCTFRPGPGLNLVLGPNGTGKSSIVSALCLGLAGNPKLLGRASKAKDYIKHGKDSAFIEIELYQEGKNNAVLKRTWKQNASSSEWKLNGKSVKQEFVESFIAKKNIKLDNLTQFLPQDNVCEFAALDPVQLLEATEGAVLPPQIVAYHKDLAKLKHELKDKETFLADFESVLTTLQKKNEMLERDVERFKQREAHLLKAEQLRMKLPLLEYAGLQDEAKTIRDQLNQAKDNLETYKSQIQPLLDQVKNKKAEIAEVEQRRGQLKKETKNNNNFDGIITKLERLETQISEQKSELSQIENRQKAKEQKKKVYEEKIHSTKQILDNLPDKDELNSQLHQINKSINDVDKQQTEVENQKYDVVTKMEDVDKEKRDITLKIQALDNVKTQRLKALSNVNHGAYEAYKFYQQNQDKFYSKVYFVPLELSIPDKNHAKFLELQCPNYLLLAFICLDSRDRETLVSEMTDRRKIDITVILNEQDPKYTPNHPANLQDLKKYGVTHFLDQTFDAPDIVKKVMNESAYIAGVAVGSDKSNVEKFFQETNVSTLFTPQSQYVSIKSKYGNKEKSTRVLGVRESRILTGVDLQQKEELQTQLSRVSEKWKLLQNKKEEFQKQEQKLVTKKENFSGEQRQKRKQLKQIDDLSRKIKDYEEALRELEEEEDVQAKQNAIFKKIRTFNLRRVELVKQLSSSMKKYHQSILKESAFPFELATHNEELKNLLEKHKETEENHERLKKEVQMLQEKFDNSKRILLQAKEQAEKTKKDFQEKHGLSDAEMKTLLLSLPDDVITLKQSIDVEESSAEAIYHDPTIIKQYEERKLEIARRELQLQTHRDSLKEATEKIDNVKNLWLPELQKCVSSINETFMQYCKNIGIVGEVHLIPNDDFAKYEIQIKVKFRDSEALSTLSTFRQSGGERSVTTILYLLALQGLNKCPLRVVDEINQGMDPVNERKIFLQMLESSRGENVPQAFLITPKLLPDLVPENTDNITVLFIFNGPYNITQNNLMDELK